MPEASSAVRSARTEASPFPLRILVVDDYSDAADSLALVLELWNYEVRVCYTAIDAIAAAIDWKPDVALVDLWLPGMGGCELAAYFRREAEFADVILIAVTGLADDVSRHESEVAGFFLHLAKRVIPAKLHAVLAAVGESKRLTK